MKKPVMKMHSKHLKAALDDDTAIVFTAIEILELWERPDLGNALRAMVLDFRQRHHSFAASKRRLPGQPSHFVTNRLRARTDKSEAWPMAGTTR